MSQPDASKVSERLAPPSVQDTQRMKRARPPSPKSHAPGVENSRFSQGLSASMPSSAADAHSSTSWSPSSSRLHGLSSSSPDSVEPPRKGPRLEPRASSHADIMSEYQPLAPHASIGQRRAQRAPNKVPSLYLSSKSNDRSTLYDHDVPEPAIRSAPPQQRQFGPDARLPPPSFLFKASERDMSDNEELQKHRHLPYQQHEIHGYLPTPGGTPRLFCPQYSALPSPAYHTSRIDPYAARSTRERHSIQYELARRASDPHAETDFGTARPRSPISKKAHFLSLFSDFFDSLSDSRTLKATLEHQIRASNTLLQTLQRSSEVLEEAVDQRLQRETKAWESRFIQMEARLKQMEARLDTQMHE